MNDENKEVRNRSHIEIDPEESLKDTRSIWSRLMKQSLLDLLTLFLSETLATALLVFLGCMGEVGSDHYKPTHFTVALGFGLAVMISLNIFGMVSGAHMNPCLTLCAYVYKRVTAQAAMFYCVGQLLGGYLGYGLLRLLLPQESDKFCVSTPTVGYPNAFVIEFMITMVLIWMCCGVWDPRQSTFHDSVALRFGMAVTCLALVGGPFSGGSMNPARSLGPAIYNWNWEHQWLYWAAPLSATIIASVMFRIIFYREPKPTLEKLPLCDKEHVEK